MPDAPPSSSPLDKASKLLTLVSLALAAYAAWTALPFDAEIKRLQAETQRLDLALKQADADLKGLESNRKVTLELYQEVKNVIEKKDKDPREEEAVRVLVEALADDPFRWKLLNVIAAGAKSADVKQAAAEASVYYREQAQVQQARPNAPAPTAAGDGIKAFNVDIFYCEKKQASAEPAARRALSLKQASDTGRWRLRALPESINQQPGYGINENLIRFTPPEERAAADAMASRLATQSVAVRLQETSYPTPGYISVFLCQ